MKATILTRFPDPDTAARWRECLEKGDFPTHYTTPEYFLEPYFAHHDPFAILAFDGDRVTGILTGLHVGSTIECGHSGRPQICLRNGIDVAPTMNCLLGALPVHSGRSVSLIEAFSWTNVDRPLRGGFRVRKLVGEHGVILLDLSKGERTLFSELSETRRNKVRRALRFGVEVSALDIATQFDTYYDLYRHWCAFKNIPAHSYDIQRAAFELKQNRLALAATHKGLLIGVSIFRFCPGGVVEYAANVSRREETKVRQNDLLLWKGIEWAAQNGFRLFSMAAAHFFLQTYGGAPVSTYRYRSDRTFLKRHDTKEALLALRNKAYCLLSERLKKSMKTLVGKA